MSHYALKSHLAFFPWQKQTSKKSCHVISEVCIPRVRLTTFKELFGYLKNPILFHEKKNLITENKLIMQINYSIKFKAVNVLLTSMPWYVNNTIYILGSY